MIGKSDKNLAWDTSSAKLYQAEDNYVLETAKPLLNKQVPMQFPFEDKTCVLRIDKFPYFDETGKTLGIIGVFEDITDKVLYENSQQTLKQTQSDFLFNVTHDLRTPLVAILTLSELIKTSADPSKVNLMADKLHLAAKQMHALVDELLEFSQSEKEPVKVKSAPCDLKQLIDETLSVIEPLTFKKKIKLAVYFCDNFPQNFNSDSPQLRRILSNLLSNAVKFTEQGRITVNVSTHKKSNTVSSVKIEVKDTGIGIPEDKLHLIFDPFTRMGLSNNSPYKGTGLGLTITKKLVEALAGTINVNSTLNQGTCFTVDLPCSLATQNSALEASP